MVRQAILLGYLPRQEIRHTSEHEIGQIYLPLVNWLLLGGIVIVILWFQSSSNLAAAYGIAQTAPYLFIGELADLTAFSASLLASHAQGWERDPWNFDKYPITLPAYGRRPRVTLSPAAVRAAMAAYLQTLPPEPSPFVPLGATTLPAPARAGLRVFRARCASCHRLVRDSGTDQPVAEAELERELLRGGVALTSPLRYRTGTPDLTPSGNNPPSLRGIWDSGPYFSDGSAGSLAEVLRRTHADPAAAAVHAAANAWPVPSLPPAEREALLALLRCL